MSSRTTGACHIRGCSVQLLNEFELLQKRLGTRTQADTLLALCRITESKLKPSAREAKQVRSEGTARNVAFEKRENEWFPSQKSSP